MGCIQLKHGVAATGRKLNIENSQMILLSLTAKTLPNKPLAGFKFEKLFEGRLIMLFYNIISLTYTKYNYWQSGWNMIQFF